MSDPDFLLGGQETSPEFIFLSFDTQREETYFTRSKVFSAATLTSSNEALTNVREFWSTKLSC